MSDLEQSGENSATGLRCFLISNKCVLGCVCGWVGVWSACMYALVCAWIGESSPSAVFLSNVPFLNSLRQGPSLTLELTSVLV